MQIVSQRIQYSILQWLHDCGWGKPCQSGNKHQDEAKDIWMGRNVVVELPSELTGRILTIFFRIKIWSSPYLFWRNVRLHLSFTHLIAISKNKRLTSNDYFITFNAWYLSSVHFKVLFVHGHLLRKYFLLIMIFIIHFHRNSCNFIKNLIFQN